MVAPVCEPEELKPTVGAWFMLLISGEEAPFRPKSIIYHSIWPSFDGKLIFRRSVASTGSWWEIKLGEKARPPRTGEQCVDVLQWLDSRAQRGWGEGG